MGLTDTSILLLPSETLTTDTTWVLLQLCVLAADPAHASWMDAVRFTWTPNEGARVSRFSASACVTGRVMELFELFVSVIGTSPLVEGAYLWEKTGVIEGIRCTSLLFISPNTCPHFDIFSMGLYRWRQCC